MCLRNAEKSLETVKIEIVNLIIRNQKIPRFLTKTSLEQVTA